MSKERILIVEDERIVAEDLKRMLERLGYEVVGTADNGEDAIAQVEKTKPDLVLMDIRIQGPMDGIEVAEHIYAHQEIPVSYLTAYADEATLDRAKATMPFGYILKPFEERNLQTTIELALYRHKMDAVFRKMENWHASTMHSLAEAVLTTDPQGNILFMNKTAETLTGQTLDKDFRKPLSQLVKFKNDDTTSMAFIEKSGRQIPLQTTRSTIKDQNGRATGSAWILREPAPASLKLP